ncbi:hypothetical protein KY289_014031 [Solanum tuberosum]|nr:hypothetical protein KY289_014031 [Solanum tuberosum]
MANTTVNDVADQVNSTTANRVPPMIQGLQTPVDFNHPLYLSNPDVSVYDRCKLKGHLKMDYYRLVKYPPGHRRHGEMKEGAENKLYNSYDNRCKPRRASAHNDVVSEESDTLNSTG